MQGECSSNIIGTGRIIWNSILTTGIRSSGACRNIAWNCILGNLVKKKFKNSKILQFINIYKY